MRTPPMLVVAVLLLGLGTQPSVAAPNGMDRILFGDQDALLVMAPDIVSSWEVHRAEWAPDGRHILVGRSYLRVPPIPMGPPNTQHSLVLWDADQRKSVELWKATSPMNLVPTFEWLSSGGVAFAMVMTGTPPVDGQPVTPPRQWLMRIDARRPATRTLFEVPNGTALYASRLDPLAVLVSDTDRTIRVLRADGTVARQVKFPEGVTLHSPGWTRDGGRLFLAGFGPGDQPNTNKNIRMVFDPRTGELVPATERDRLGLEPQTAGTPRFRLRHSEGSVQQGAVRQEIRPLWLEAVGKDPQPRILVSANADWGKLSPRGDAILYLSEGAAMVAQLIQLPKEAFTKARDAAMRQSTISRGKQLGLAVIVWADRNDKRLPGQDEPIHDLLRPILQTDELFSGFVYSFPGGKLADVANPAETILGYVTGPGGRAEIFVDGHVVWKPD
jgi:hypothetical protein